MTALLRSKDEGPLGLFRDAFAGQSVTHVWRGHGSALFIELGDLRPTNRRDGSVGPPTGELGVMIGWNWRIEEGSTILVGSGNAEDLWAPAFARLVGHKVSDLWTVGRLPEIALALSGDLHVISFTPTEGDPAWALFDRRGSEIETIEVRQGVLWRGVEGRR